MIPIYIAPIQIKSNRSKAFVNEYISYIMGNENNSIFPTAIQLFAGTYVNGIYFEYEENKKIGVGNYRKDYNRQIIEQLHAHEYIIAIDAYIYQECLLEIKFHTTEKRCIMMKTNAQYLNYPKETQVIGYRLPTGCALVGIDTTLKTIAPFNEGISDLHVMYSPYETIATAITYEEKRQSEFTFYTLQNNKNCILSTETVLKCVMQFPIENSMLFCGSLSVGEDNTYYPHQVKLDVYDANNQLFSKSENEQQYVTVGENGIYQFSCAHPQRGMYHAVLTLDRPSEFFFEVQDINKVLEVASSLEGYNQINFPTQEIIYPVIGRPKIKLAAVLEDPSLANQSDGVDALHWIYLIKGFFILHPAVAAVVLVAAVTVVAVGLNVIAKNKKKDPLPWADVDNNWAIIETEEAKSIKMINFLKQSGYVGVVSKEMNSFYKELSKKISDFNVEEISKSNWINRDDLINNKISKLCVDIGGEGCYWTNYTFCAGAHDALNFNSLKRNTMVVMNPRIPLLFYIPNWANFCMPIENSLVDRVIIQGITGNLEKAEKDEIIRCINKRNGRIDIWYVSPDICKTLLKDAEDMANLLKAQLVYNAEEPDYEYLREIGMYKVSIIIHH